jgi:HSP20 family protein
MNKKVTRSEMPEKSCVETPDVEGTRTRPIHTPATDIVESESGLTLRLDVPGAREEKVEVNLDGDVLTVTATIEEELLEGYRPLYSEYRSGDYRRSFRLIEEFDTEKIEATLTQGVLTLVLPKVAKKQPRKIEIKTG